MDEERNKSEAQFCNLLTVEKRANIICILFVYLRALFHICF
jgi:hypothetical protein